MSSVRVGPAGIPSRESPDEAVELLVAGGYDACEIEFGRGFWMDSDYTSRLGRLAREAGVALSIHAPLAGFLGHAEYGGRKHHIAMGDARPHRGDRRRVRSGAGGDPSRVPARS